MLKVLILTCVVVAVVGADSDRCKTDADFGKVDQEFGKCLDLNYGAIYSLIDPGVPNPSYCLDSVKGLRACQRRFDNCYSPIAIRLVFLGTLR